MLVLLIATQVFLSRRTNRTLNLPLLAATVLSAGLIIGLFSTITNQNRLLHIAKEDAFDSIHALWQVRAVANDANADESLYLLAPTERARYTTSFRSKVALLCDPAPNQAFYDTIAQQSKAGGKVLLQGYFGSELNNITFPGERDAALAMLQAYVKYLEIDTRIRSLEESRHHAEAVRLCIGNNKGQSNYVFNQFEEALLEVLSINQKEFEGAVAAAKNGLSGWFILAPVVCLSIAILGWFGLLPRIREYTG